jgi:transcriptional regulator with AAA-type ATPase domain
LTKHNAYCLILFKVEAVGRDFNYKKGIIFLSPQMKRIYNIIKAYAINKERILLHGPPGCGKEYLAKYYAEEFYHHHSETKRGMFYSTNCACLNDSNAHIELFGLNSKVFSDVVEDRDGYFQIAKGSVLFLDEIADLPEKIQPTLLRALSPGVASRMGDKEKKAYSTKDVTVISATEKSLEVDSFRPALRERLGQIIEIPGLSERPDDIVLALENFYRRIIYNRRKNERLNDYPWLKNLTDVIGEIIEKTKDYAVNQIWPGNFRSLKQTVVYSVLLARLDSKKVFINDVIANFQQHVRSKKESSRTLIKIEHHAGRERPQRMLNILLKEFKKTSAAKLKEFTDYLNSSQGQFFKTHEIANELGVSKGTAQRWLNSLVNANLIRVTNDSLYSIRREDDITIPQQLRPPKYDESMVKNHLHYIGELHEYLSKCRGIFFEGDEKEEKFHITACLAETLKAERAVLWYTFKEDKRVSGVRSTSRSEKLNYHIYILEFLSIIQEYFLQKKIISSPLLDIGKTNDLPLQAAAFAGYTAMAFKNSEKPVVVLHDVDTIASKTDHEALEAIINYWLDCFLILIGRKKPNYINLTQDRDLVEYNLR